MSDNIIDFMEMFNQKQAEKYKGSTDKSMKMYMTIALFKVELITRQDVSNDETVIANMARCFYIANSEFVADDEYLNKYGEDEDTPSIQLLIINRVINRALELYFGESYQPDKIKD